MAARRPWLPSEIPLAPRKPRPLLLALHFEIEKIAHSTGDDATRPTAFSRNGCSNMKPVALGACMVRGVRGFVLDVSPLTRPRRERCPTGWRKKAHRWPAPLASAGIATEPGSRGNVEFRREVPPPSRGAHAAPAPSTADKGPGAFAGARRSSVRHMRRVSIRVDSCRCNNSLGDDFQHQFRLAGVVKLFEGSFESFTHRRKRLGFKLSRFYEGLD